MFSTEHVARLFQILLPDIGRYLALIDGLQFEQGEPFLNNLRAEIDSHGAKWTYERDEVINEVYVIHRLVDFLSAYSSAWRNICEAKFANSWSGLQSSMDHLRSVKKFTKVNSTGAIGYFEDQLVELEKLYPYNVFFSIGVSVDCFECSICGKDIDSLECEHVKGELYRGKMAHGIAKNVGSVDHVAMVKHPEDKRCVVKYDDDGPQFNVVRYVSDLLKSKQMRPLSFHHLEFSKKMDKNPDYQKLSRNEKCFCGSDKKFKNCCIDKHIVEFDHVQIISRNIDPTSIFE